MAVKRIVTGTHYTQAVKRDQQADFATALGENPTDHDALMALWRWGYDVSQARIQRTK